MSLRLAQAPRSFYFDLKATGFRVTHQAGRILSAIRAAIERGQYTRKRLHWGKHACRITCSLAIITARNEPQQKRAIFQAAAHANSVSVARGALPQHFTGLRHRYRRRVGRVTSVSGAESFNGDDIAGL
jgi:hypothetical protein